MMSSKLTHLCGCTGPAFHDDYGNVYVRPEKTCTDHTFASGVDFVHVYECGCHVKIRDISTDDCTNFHKTAVRCAVHNAAQSRDEPFGFSAVTMGLPCGCVGTPIGVSVPRQRPLMFVPGSKACRLHAIFRGEGSFVMAQCGCAFNGITDVKRCDLHRKAAEQRFTDPFMKPSEKPVVLQ